MADEVVNPEAAVTIDENPYGTTVTTGKNVVTNKNNLADREGFSDSDENLNRVSIQMPESDNQKKYDYDINFLTPAQAYEKGRLLRAQFKNEEARHYLQYAADKGNADAAYLYAIELSEYNPTIRTPRLVREYVEQAANSGNLHAMNYLYQHGTWLRTAIRQSWQKRYHDGLVRLAATQPAKAVYYLSLYYEKTDPDQSEYYLQRAIDYSYPLAWMDNSRRSINDINQLYTETRFSTGIYTNYRHAAEHNFIPAMKACVELYEGRGDFKKAFEWRQRALDAGDLTSLAVVAKIYAGEASSYRFVDEDLIKARAYSELYLDYAGSDRLTSLHKSMEQFFVDITNEMTPPDIERAQSITDTYKEKVTFYNHDTYWDL
ncbi:sel1 repeat family protein [Vibrio ruber]|uniref:sel1 repeat family protein n=1 Tax=Vibrio ruber TaxID=184755 RepID=UPI00289328A5|nr:sel1 repeat family protein [Vibrio ruber]WNJ98007.1 sel1 repeat family protein [Vibrio ruber]